MIKVLAVAGVTYQLVKLVGGMDKEETTEG
jgi:hypothetical protein